ncbi:cytochrome b5 [Coniochaeta sp. PMI_546]|nr:cytochrome b5 [Coniochaeta sp. PMI_546]
MSKSFSAAEVAKHKTEADGVWLIIDGGVYDVTKFMDDHPGGSKILKRMGGKDASKQFWKYHNDKVLAKYGDKLKIGTVEDKAKL